MFFFPPAPRAHVPAPSEGLAEEQEAVTGVEKDGLGEWP